MAVSAVTADRRLGVVPGRMSVVSDNNASTPRFLDEAIEMQHTAQYTRTPAQVHVANDRVTSWDFPLAGTRGLAITAVTSQKMEDFVQPA